MSPFDCSLAVKNLEPSQSFFKPQEVGSPDPSPIPRNDQSQKGDTVPRIKNTAFVFMNSKSQRPKIFLNLHLCLPQKILVIVKNDEVIHVTEIISAFKSLLNKMIEAVEINVGKELGC